MKTRKLAIFLGIIMLLGTLAVVGGVGAEPNAPSTYIVNYVHDQIDKNPGDNICATAAGICTLRAAVMEANAHPGWDTIKLARINSGSTPDVFKFLIGGVDGDTPNAAVGDLDITDSVTISGFNAVWTVIDADSKDRVFDIHGGTYVDFSNMLIRNGATQDTNAQGGGIYAHGIRADLRYVTLEKNKAFVGGGIYNTNEMSLSRVTVRNNVSGDGWTPGGGLYNEGGLTIDQSTFNGNKAYMGAGLFHGKAGATITNSTFSDNRANGDGSGIAVQGAQGTYLDLSNVTIAFNVADADNSNSGDAGGIYNFPGSTVLVRNSIIAGNIDNSSNDDDDCYGDFQSGGYNLIGHNWLCGPFNAAGDQTGGPNAFLDPKLGPLQKNGGSTATHALLANSPAINTGNPNGCKNKLGQLLSYDQRNFQRHYPSQCDIGAYENGSHYITPTPVPTNTPTPTATPPSNECQNKPAAPQLSKPKANAEVKSQTPQLDWNDVQCATKYKVVVKKDAKNGVKAFKKAVTVSQVKTTALEKGHTYYWWVKACNAQKQCTKSAWGMFTIKP